MKEGDQILAAYAAGNPRMIAFVTMRLDDGVTEADIRTWYNKPPKKRTKILNTELAAAMIFVAAEKALGDREKAIEYAKTRVPWLTDALVDGPPPDKADLDRPLFCCLQPRIDRWLSRMRLYPCTNDELDQRMASEGHKSVNSLIRAEIAEGNL
jgi:hypothetical protein